MGAKRAASAHRPQDPLEAAVRREYPKLIQRAEWIQVDRHANDPTGNWTLHDVLGVALRLGLEVLEHAKEEEARHA